MLERYWSAHSSTDTQPNHNKTTPTASSTETILVPSGVSKVTKNKSPKSDPITEFSTGHSSDSSALSIQAASEEVIPNSFPFCGGIYLIEK